MPPSPEPAPGPAPTALASPEPADLTWEAADSLAQRHGDAFYIFDPAAARERVAHFRAAFRPGDLLLYPYKTNPYPDVLDTLHALGVGAETCSAPELRTATGLGITGELLHSTGCGRTPQELQEAADAGATVIIDHPSDVPPLAGRDVRVGLRCDFPLGDRRASRFGVPLDDVADAAALIRATPGLRFAGLHCHFPGTEAAFDSRARGLLAATRIAFPDSPPDFLCVGGGFHGGVPAPVPGTSPSDYAALLLPALTDAFGTETPTLVLEPGAALVAAAFTFVTRVRVVKPQPNRPSAVVAGSLFDISPNTRRTDLPVHTITRSRGAARGEVDITGATPMPDEYLALGVPGPLEPGDFVCFHRVGAYSWAMAPEWLRDRAPVLTRRPIDDIV